MPELRPLDDTATRWSAESSERGGRPLLVLLHGYGSDERDLFALARSLPPAFVIAALRAPLTPGFPAPGFSWYPIGHEPAREGSDYRGPEDATDAASLVLDWVQASAPDAVVGLLGFSQGAAVALQAMRLDPERFAFAVNLSGYATPGAVAGDAVLVKRRPPVFWGRGTNDDVIPSFLVEHTATWLPEHTDLSGRVYPGLTHSVSEAELDDVRVFLERQLADLDSAS